MIIEKWQKVEGCVFSILIDLLILARRLSHSARPPFISDSVGISYYDNNVYTYELNRLNLYK